jgi:excisionase family DNA binding protein
MKGPQEMSTTTLDVPELRGKRNLKVDEAAIYLGLGRTKIYALIAAGRLESMKIDGARRIPVAAIETFLAVQTAG